MGRKKLNLQWVSNDVSRRATFNKRRQGLIKKTSELATLCGVKVCVLAYGENEVRPKVWPSVAEAKNLLASFKATEELQQWNKKTSHQDLLKKRISKLQDQVRRSGYGSQGRETSILFQESMAGRRPGLVGVTPIEVIRLREAVERKVKAIQEHLEQLGVQPEQPLPQQQLPDAWSSMMQPQVPIAFTEMHGQALEEEPLRHKQDMLTGNGSCAGPIVQP